MKLAIAFYKGPPSSKDLVHVVTHYGIKAGTFSKYSHTELVIDGKCYSSSARDGGVRSKDIDLTSGKWDVIPIKGDVEKALKWFEKYKGCKYDWRGILRYLLVWLGHTTNKFICFEAVGRMLGLAGCHRLTANDLYEWALENREDSNV